MLLKEEQENWLINQKQDNSKSKGEETAAPPNYLFRHISDLITFSVYEVRDADGRFLCVVNYCASREFNLDNHFWSELTDNQQQRWNPIREAFCAFIEGMRD